MAIQKADLLLHQTLASSMMMKSVMPLYVASMDRSWGSLAHSLDLCLLAESSTWRTTAPKVMERMTARYQNSIRSLPEFLIPRGHLWSVALVVGIWRGLESSLQLLFLGCSAGAGEQQVHPKASGLLRPLQSSYDGHGISITMHLLFHPQACLCLSLSLSPSLIRIRSREHSKLLRTDRTGT